MVKMLSFSGVVMLAIFVLAEGAQGQKKEKATADPATPQEYAQLRNLREISGRIVFADESARTLAFRVDIPQIQANPGNKGPQPARPGKAKKGKGYPAKPNVKIVTISKDFELEVEDKAPVRKMFVAVEYDDKGFVRNNEEQAALLRTKGYIPAKYEDIKSGMVAKFYLNPPRAGGDDQQAGRPTIKMIMLLQAGTGSLQQTAPPKKKDK